MPEGTSHTAELGSILADRYELITTIGQGGMGCVYKARHRQVGRTYAVKLLWKAKKEDEKTYRRFLQEAKIAGSLSHPNLTAVYDYGESDDGHPFIVMDFVDGICLSEMLESQGPLALSRALQIFLQIASGLRYAHEKGLVHRDLKPANVMLVATEHGEQVKIVDFGIAKQLVGTGNEPQQLTNTGEIFGSPYYASPEQCIGDKVDNRSDIYSLGCLMYEALTGRRPIDGENAIQTILAHIQQAPAPFSEVCPEARIPAEIENIVFKCLGKKPDQRYQSVCEVADDLEKCLSALQNGTLVFTEKPRSAPATASRLSTKRIAMLAMAALAGAGLIAISYRQLNANRSAQRPSAQAAAPILQVSAASEKTPPKQTSTALAPSAPAAATAAQATVKPLGKPAASQAQAASTALTAETRKKANLTRSAEPKAKEKPQIALAPAQTAAAQVKQMKAAQELALLQRQAVPAMVQAVNKITAANIIWEVDWPSFKNNPDALEAFQYFGLRDIHEGIKQFWQSHNAEELKRTVTRIRIRNVSEIYERHVVLKSGVLTIYGAWGHGLAGSPTDLEIGLAMAAGLQ